MNQNPDAADDLTATPDLIRAALWDRGAATRQFAERWAERFGITATTSTSTVHDDPKDVA